MISKSYRETCKHIENQLEFYAMMRSGQHAIIYWLFGQINKPIYFHNDILCHNYPGILSDKGEWLNAEKNHSSDKFDWFAYNLEDISILKIEEIYNKYLNILNFIEPKKRNKILIIRDPFNLFASRYRIFYRLNKINKHNGVSETKKNKETNYNSNIAWFDQAAVDRWKEYAEEYLGDTNFLGSDKVSIDYNLWFKNKKYRQDISYSLGLNFSDAKLNFVPNYGHGSSFDVRTMNKKAQDMDVFNRWKHFVEDDQFIDIINDKEMLRLSRRIYPTLTDGVIKELGL